MHRYTVILQSRATGDTIFNQIDTSDTDNIMQIIASRTLPISHPELYDLSLVPGALVKRLDAAYIVMSIVELDVACDGCRNDQPGQSSHMGVGGCMEQPDD